MNRQVNGKIKEKLIAGSEPTVSKSIIDACMNGRIAPPTIAITRPAAPNLASLGFFVPKLARSGLGLPRDQPALPKRVKVVAEVAEAEACTPSNIMNTISH